MLLKFFLIQLYRVVFAVSVVVFTSPFLIYSCVVLVVIKTFYRLVLGRRFRILCGFDACLQAHTKSYFTSQDCVTSTLMTVIHKGSADIRKWRYCINQNWFLEPKYEEQVSLFSKFQCRIVKKFGFFIWENDPNFSVDNHIRLWEDSYEDEDSLMNICSQILQQSLSQDHSPWEIVLVRKSRHTASSDINQDQEDNSYASVWKVHHSLSDGSLLLMLLSSISDKKCQQWFRQTYEFSEDKSGVSPSFVKNNPVIQYLTARKRIKLFLGMLFKMATNFVHSLILAINFFSDNIIRKDKNNLHGPPLVGRKLIAVTRRLDLKTFKIISKAYNSTTNDIFISCIAGAVKVVDPSISHGRIGLAFGNIMPGSFGLQNTIAIAAFRTDLTPETSFLRLQQISKKLRYVKLSSLPLGLLVFFSALGNHFPAFLLPRLTDLNSATVYSSCLRGPDFEYSVVGDVVTDVLFNAINLGRSSGVSFSFLSSNGSVRIGVTVDRVVALDDSTAKKLISATEEEVWKLHKAALNCN